MHKVTGNAASMVSRTDVTEILSRASRNSNECIEILIVVFGRLKENFGYHVLKSLWLLDCLLHRGSSDVVQGWTKTNIGSLRTLETFKCGKVLLQKHGTDTRNRVDDYK
jgi:hypothetical protein